MENKGFWKFLDNSKSGSNFYQNLNCLISVRSRRVLLRSSLSSKLVTLQIFKSQCLPCSFLISNHTLCLKAICRFKANSYFRVLGSSHPQDFNAMITSDRQYVPRTPITRLVKNKEYQSFQPIIWPEKSVSHVSRRMENRAGGGILSNDNDSCAP